MSVGCAPCSVSCAGRRDGSPRKTRNGSPLHVAGHRSGAAPAPMRRTSPDRGMLTRRRHIAARTVVHLRRTALGVPFQARGEAGGVQQGAAGRTDLRHRGAAGAIDGDDDGLTAVRSHVQTQSVKKEARDASPKVEFGGARATRGFVPPPDERSEASRPNRPADETPSRRATGTRIARTAPASAPHVSRFLPHAPLPSPTSVRASVAAGWPRSRCAWPWQHRLQVRSSRARGGRRRRRVVIALVGATVIDVQLASVGATRWWWWRGGRFAPWCRAPGGVRRAARASSRCRGAS